MVKKQHLTVTRLSRGTIIRSRQEDTPQQALLLCHPAVTGSQLEGRRITQLQASSSLEALQLLLLSRRRITTGS